MANLMDCYISQRKPVLPVVTQSERSSCEVTQRNFKKGLDPAHHQKAQVSEWVQSDRPDVKLRADRSEIRRNADNRRILMQTMLRYCDKARNRNVKWAG